MRTRIFLDASDTTLVGQYPPEAEHVHVYCDSSKGAFSVTLPDLKNPVHTEFVFYNIPLTGSGAAVTILTSAGQTIGNNEYSHIIKPFDSAVFVSDLVSRWLHDAHQAVVVDGSTSAFSVRLYLLGTTVYMQKSTNGGITWVNTGFDWDLS
jgi:hypothetical protein